VFEEDLFQFVTAFQYSNCIIGVTTGSPKCCRLHILAILFRALNLLLFLKSISYVSFIPTPTLFRVDIILLAAVSLVALTGLTTRL
jgi:hypothetical protein